MPIEGCMDVNATNYNSTVEVDDGSCEYPEPIEGCMDVNATNYNSTAEIGDDSCEYPEPVKGCTNETANNYNSTAEVDDGSCDFTEEKLDYCPDEINEDNENLVDDSCLVPVDENVLQRTGVRGDPCNNPLIWGHPSQSGRPLDELEYPLHSGHLASKQGLLYGSPLII